MRRKSIFILVACLMAVFMSGAAVACSDKNPDPTPDTPPISDSGTPDVEENRAYWLKVNYESLELLKGETFSLGAKLYLGTTAVEGVAFTWQSENPSIASVNNSGLVTAEGEGETKIVVTASGYTDVQCSITVKVNPLFTLDLSEYEIELAKIALAGYETSAEVDCKIKWNNQEVNDGTLTVASSNENVEATVSGNKIIVRAVEIGDSVVTAKYVKDGKTVETQVNVSVIKPYIASGETYLLSTGNKNALDLSLLDCAKDYTADSIISVRANDKEFPIVTATGSVLTLSDTASLGYDGSTTTAVTLETDMVRIGVDVKGYTHVIRSVKDFDDMKDFLVDTTLTAGKQSGLQYCKMITGYYILANDIDFAEEYPNGYASPFSYPDVGYKMNGDTHGWKAVFDGNGHVINGIKLIQSATPAGTWNNSLFGTIAGGGGVVKNVAFTNCEVDASLYGSAFLANFVYGKIENVYLDVKVNTNTKNSNENFGNSAFVGMDKNAGLKSTWAETSISDVTVIVRDSLGEYDYVTKGTQAGVQNSFKGTFVTIGGGYETRINDSYSTISAIRAENSNVKAYANIVNATKDTSLTKCGSATFDTDGATFTVSWNGEVLYTTLVYTTVSEKLYSIDDATLDLTGIVGEVERVTDEAGNEIAYNTQTNKISNHAILNSQNPKSATGAVIGVIVYTTEGIYKLPLKVCTDVINSATEFDEMKKFLVDTTVAAGSQSGLKYCKKIEGYYVLGNDIDFADGFANGYNSPFSYMNIGYKWAEATGWLGTFDGNGYVIRNLKIIETTQGTAGAYDNSLFGTIGNGGTVKNVAFKNASVAENLHCSAVFANAIFGVVNNVYIEASLSTTVTSEGNFVFAGVNKDQRGVVSYANVSNVTIVVNGLGAIDYVMGGDANGVGGIKSMVIIGAPGTKIHGGYTTLEALTTANAKIKVYTSVANVTATTCGSAAFAKADNKFLIKWNEKTVYEKELLA